jgi:helicase
MTTTNGEPADSFLRIVGSDDFQREVAQVRAKAVLAEILDEVPAYNWTYSPTRLVRNSVGASLALEAAPASVQRDAWSIPALRLARLWESLAKIHEGVSTETAILNAAVSYEYAGYQANAACLARAVPVEHDEDRPRFEQLVALFLRRWLVRLRLEADIAAREPDIDSGPDQVLGAVALALAGGGLSDAAKFLLGGNVDAYDRAVDRLREAQRAYSELAAPAEANLAGMLASLLPLLRVRSTWEVVGSAVSNARWRRYLTLLGRGTGRTVLESSSVSEVWPSQLRAIEHGLLTDGRNKIIRMPTSAGKTRVAEMAMVHMLATELGSKCVYIAPYRALVGEIEEAFSHFFSDLGYRLSSILGTYESDDFEQLLIADADVLVVTPEKLDLLQRFRPEFLASVRLLILDESQLLDDLSRGVKFEILLTRLKRLLPSARFLVLSAVFPQETLEDFSTWLNTGSDGVITETWRPSLQRVAKFEWTGKTGVLRYAPEREVPMLSEFVPGVVRERAYHFINEETGRWNTRRFPAQDNKGQTAAELSSKLSELGPVLVFCSQTNFAQSVAKALEARLDLMEKVDETIPSFFRTPHTQSVRVAREWLGEDHFVTRLLKRGIAIHHGKLPDALRKSVEDDFRNRRYRILVATNTLAQGVNLPVRTIIVHSVWRTYVDQTRERLSARDYWNIAGRAGRAREETEGTVIHIVASRNDERDYREFLDRRDDVEPVESALFQVLKALVDERISEEHVATELDSEIVGLLAEEGLDPGAPETFDDFLADSLVAAQAERRNVPLEPLRRVFSRARTLVQANVPSPGLLRTYSTTGLSSRSCEIFRAHASDNGGILIKLLTDESARAADLAGTLMAPVLTVEEMQSEEAFAGSYDELLMSWMSGMAMSDIRAEFSDEVASVEDLASFIDDVFSYRLPWGLSGYVRVAEATLEIDPGEFSAITRFLPSMMKFGVPTPEAAWAMAAGVPLRSAAVALATAFLAQVDDPSQRAFLGWLGGIGADELQQTYGIRGAALAEVTRAVARSSVNQMLVDSADLDDHLPLIVVVRGVRFDNRRIAAARVSQGNRLELRRDYENVIDRNAVSVLFRRDEIGFIPRDAAQLFAPELDAGVQLQATAVAIAGRTTPRVMLRVTRASS